MKRYAINILFSIFFILTLPSPAHAQQAVKPDIRNYDVHVISRPMPTTICPVCGTPIECIEKYIGFNKLTDDTMKFSNKLFGVGDQFERASTRLTPYMVKTNIKTTMDEPGNKPAWVGEICCYGGVCGNGLPIIGKKVIEAEDPITTMFKQIRFGSNLLSSFIARDHTPLSGGVYNTQRNNITADPNLQSKCDAKPPGVLQSDLSDKGKGINEFHSLGGLIFDIVCSTDVFNCNCEMTHMYIKTDSMVQYNTDALCRSTGCTDEQLSVVAPESRALPQAKDSGGFINAQSRPGLMAQVQEMITQLFGSITGKVDNQQTTNNVNTKTAPSSYYTTKAIEVGADFLNCSLFPYAKRQEMPECKTNWLQALVASISNQMQTSGTTTATQGIAEPTEEQLSVELVATPSGSQTANPSLPIVPIGP